MHNIIQHISMGELTTTDAGINTVQCLKLHQKLNFVNNNAVVAGNSLYFSIPSNYKEQTDPSDFMLIMNVLCQWSYKCQYSNRLNLFQQEYYYYTCNRVTTLHHSTWIALQQYCTYYDHNVINCYDSYNEVKRGYWFGSVTGIPTTSSCPNHYCNFPTHKETRQGYFELPNNIDGQCV